MSLHPDKPLVVGGYVLVQRRGKKGEPPAAVIKRLIRRTEAKVVLEQFNPHKLIDIKNTDIVSMHRVVGSAEK